MEVTGNLAADAQSAALNILKALPEIASANEIKLAEIDLGLGIVGLIMLAAAVNRIADALESRARATQDAAGFVYTGPPPAGSQGH